VGVGVPPLPDKIYQKLTAALKYTSSQVWCYDLQFFQEFKLMLLSQPERATLRNVPIEQDLQTVVSLCDRF